MEILNITKQNISIPLLKNDNSSYVIELKENELIYVDSTQNNSVLRIYEKKNIIKISENDKPKNLKYDTIYNSMKIIEDEVVLDNILEIDLDDNKNNTQKTTPESIIEIEVIVPESSLKPINKGGRPKGSTNKKKRRPKKKGTPGRPKKKVNSRSNKK